jgi:hypothetical protein
MVFGEGMFHGMLWWFVPKIGCAIEGIKKANYGRAKHLVLCSYKYMVCECSRFVMFFLIL